MDRLASNHRNTSRLRHQAKRKNKSKLALFIPQTVWPLWIFWNPRKKIILILQTPSYKNELVLKENSLNSLILQKKISRLQISANFRPTPNRKKIGMNPIEWTRCPTVNDRNLRGSRIVLVGQLVNHLGSRTNLIVIYKASLPSLVKNQPMRTVFTKGHLWLLTGWPPAHADDGVT